MAKSTYNYPHKYLSDKERKNNFWQAETRQRSKFLQLKLQLTCIKDFNMRGVD